MEKILKMNIALFTSNHLRHKYVATEIANALSLKLIVCEQKSERIENVSQYNKEDRQLLTDHFKNRELSELHFFGKYKNFPKEMPLVDMKFGSLNSQTTLNLLKEYKIGCILLFGTSIIKPIILDKYQGKIINLHLGLSPYYKGSGTNFFPIVNNEFECLGATIHLAIDKVDSGSILHQLRLDTIEEKDNIHSLGNKVIKQAGKFYPKIVKAYLLEKIKWHEQKEVDKSKTYLLRDFTPETLKRANNVLKCGGISVYLKNKEQLLLSKPIVSNYNE